MNSNYKEHAQFELFSSSSDSFSDSGKSPSLLKDLTLSAENSIVLCIIFAMILVLFFAFGVEKGKKLAALPIETSQQKEALDIENDIIVRPVNLKAEKSNGGQISEVNKGQENTGKNNKVKEIVPVQKNVLDDLYTIQVASFKLEKNAQREAFGLKETGHDTFVVPKGSYSIVCVGKFIRREDAEEFSGRLKHKYSDFLIRRL
ncbi:MAG: SPOR domain-containing protein [Candidatus Zapsychrus exili]|nr:SPOR domain-containing protein [Candidatus Zapsychrus exili]